MLRKPVFEQKEFLLDLINPRFSGEYKFSFDEKGRLATSEPGLRCILSRHILSINYSRIQIKSHRISKPHDAVRKKNEPYFTQKLFWNRFDPTPELQPRPELCSMLWSASCIPCFKIRRSNFLLLNVGVDICYI